LNSSGSLCGPERNFAGKVNAFYAGLERAKGLDST
jgi:hypothetical protein